MPECAAFGSKSSATVRRLGGSSSPQPAGASRASTSTAITRRTGRKATRGARPCLGLDCPPPTNPSRRSPVQDRGPAAYVAEFIGTLLLVFFITAAVSLFATQPSQANPSPFIDWGVIGLVHLVVLFALVTTLAVVCGAHFNPAVTIA